MVAVPQPNPRRRRPMTVPTPPPVNRFAGIMPYRCGVQRRWNESAGVVFNILVIPGSPIHGPLASAWRRVRMFWRALVLGAVAGVGGFIPDVLALVGRDARDAVL